MLSSEETTEAAAICVSTLIGVDDSAFFLPRLLALVWAGTALVDAVTMDATSGGAGSNFDSEESVGDYYPAVSEFVQ